MYDKGDIDYCKAYSIRNKLVQIYPEKYCKTRFRCNGQDY